MLEHEIKNHKNVRITENNKRRGTSNNFLRFLGYFKSHILFGATNGASKLLSCWDDSDRAKRLLSCLSCNGVWKLFVLFMTMSEPKGFSSCYPFCGIETSLDEKSPNFFKMIDDNPIYVHGFVGSWFKRINERILSLECNNILNVMVGDWQYNSVCLRDKGVTI